LSSFLCFCNNESRVRRFEILHDSPRLKHVLPFSQTVLGT
jgi:hypothetical protein